MRAPEVGLPLLGGPRRPQRKRAHTSLSRLREEVKRRGPPAPGCRAVRDSTLVAWYRPLYAPRTGGAYDSHRWTTGIAGRTRRRGGRQPAAPVIGMIRSGLSETEPGSRMIAFRQGLNESGYIEGQNVTIESRWAEGPQDRYSDLVADLIRRKVSVIATGANTPASLAATQPRRSRSSSALARIPSWPGRKPRSTRRQ